MTELGSITSSSLKSILFRFILIALVFFSFSSASNGDSNRIELFLITVFYNLRMSMFKTSSSSLSNIFSWRSSIVIFLDASYRSHIFSLSFIATYLLMNSLGHIPKVLLSCYCILLLNPYYMEFLFLFEGLLSYIFSEELLDESSQPEDDSL